MFLGRKAASLTTNSRRRHWNDRRLAFNADYPGFFLGYLGDKLQTEAVFRESWYLTSDLATIDSDGYVAVLGRADDCFKSKGVLIVPREVEDAILGLGRLRKPVSSRCR